MPKDFKLLIGGKWTTRSNKLVIRHPLDNSVVGKVPQAELSDVDNAVASALDGLTEMRALQAYERAEKLERISQLLQLRTKEFAKLITQESGKTIREASREVVRSSHTFKIAAEEAKRLYGETIPMDALPENNGRIAITLREPIGVIAAITPFNFPLNLVAHKVAPALAAGNTIVLKPSTHTPMSALKLAEVILEVGFPSQAIQVVVGEGRSIGERLILDPRINMITFTGSAKVGKEITEKAGIKKVTLELGSNGAIILEKDADLQLALPRCVKGAFSHAGQTCIAIQRIYIHEAIFDTFKDLFIDATAKLVVGNPIQEGTDVGPMITEAEAKRAEMWIQEAVRDGATLLTGGERNNTILTPTVLSHVESHMKIMKEEVFAPIVSLIPYTELAEAIEQVNDSRYGLQAGIYTSHLGQALQAAKQIKVGGVMINEIPTWRADHMPFGGIKESGLGKEGVRYAIQEMTTSKLVVINLE